MEYFRNRLGNSNASAQHQGQRPVVINVYDMLQPSFLTGLGYYVLGVGIYHSGVAVGDKEYCFGGHEYRDMTGVFAVEPKVGPPGLLFKQSIAMGYVSDENFQKALQTISKEFLGTSYSLLTRNCNHFTDELCFLLTGKRAPAWINRAAKLGTLFPCVIPTDWVEPPDLDGSVLQSPSSASPAMPTSSSYSSSKPLKTAKQSAETSRSREAKKGESSPEKQRSSTNDGIRVRPSTQTNSGGIDNYSPIKEPDSARPEVVRSATQLSLGASLQDVVEIKK